MIKEFPKNMTFNTECFEYIVELQDNIAELEAKLADVNRAFNIECEFYDPQDMQEWIHNIEVALEGE